MIPRVDEARDNGAPASPAPRLARATASMAAGTLLSRATGLVRLAALGAAFGVTEGPLADAYNRANVAPNIVYELVLGGVLSSVLVPVFVQTLQRGEREHREVVDTVVTLAGLVLAVVAALAIVFAPAIARLLTLGATGLPADVAQLREVMVVLLRLFVPQIFFYGLTTLLTAWLNAHDHFTAPMVTPVLNNVVVTAVVLAYAALVGFKAVDLAEVTGPQLLLLGVGTTAGIAAMAVPLLIPAWRRGFRWRPRLDWRHPVVRQIGRLGGWAVLYVVVNQIGYLFVVSITGSAPVEGAYSAYFYGFTFFQLPHGIYAVSVMTALVPALARSAAAGDTDGYRRSLAQGIRATALIIVPAAAGLIALAIPAVRLFLEWGVFSADSTVLVGRTLAAFAVGLPGYSLFLLFTRASYAQQDTRTPVLVTALRVCVNIATSIVLFATLPDAWVVPGLALSHSVSFAVAAVVLGRSLARGAGGLGGTGTLPALGRITVAATATGVAALAVSSGSAEWVGVDGIGQQLVQVVGGVLAGVAAFVAAARVLRLEELDVAAAAVRRLRPSR